MSTTPDGHSNGQISNTSPFALPGFTLPLNFEPQIARYELGNRWERVPVQGDGRSLFANALQLPDNHQVGRVMFTPTTLRELNMQRFMNEITDKAQWDVKIFSDEIAEKWKTEVMHQSGDFSEKMANYCVQELRYKAEHLEENRMVTVYPGDVVKSDSAVPESLKKQLQAAASHLEALQGHEKDFHPGSDGKVLDLVHPSLFPLVYGRSRILRDRLIGLDNCIGSCGKGEVLPVPPESEAESRISATLRTTGARPYSRQFQWLPAEVEFLPAEAADQGKVKCTISSYINNLHPHRHRDLYDVVAKIIDRTIPLWDRTLTSVKHNFINPLRIPYDEVKYDPDPEKLPMDQRPQRQDGEQDDDFWGRYIQWEKDTRKLVLPEPGEFESPWEPEEPVNLAHDYAARGLQVIVKLANIHLTPEGPEYEGGTWHVEGQLNEHICATALYYYDSHNITESRLAFRQQCDPEELPLGYPQDEHDWLGEVFGGYQRGPCVQEVGDVVCREGRLLTFPNILQHCVRPFKLADPTRPGHRKILALFLVDPNIRVISTANVPPQRKDWWSEKIMELGTFGNLSREIYEMIMDAIEFPIGMDEAKQLRLDLMEERKRFSVQQEGAFQSNEFSLCEH